MTTAVFEGRANIHHWGEKWQSAEAYADAKRPMFLSLGEVIAVRGDVVIHKHESWPEPMFVDFSEANEWVLVDDTDTSSQQVKEK